ncbi:MAG: ABC transporter permease [Deltaproteobacteria bacterium]|nr:ABC transporter permease [Deltaproteobacteria bacterium]
MTVAAVAKKEFRQLGRDSRTLVFLVFVPMLMLLMFGYVLSFDVKHISLAVVDQDRTPHSRALMQALTNNEYFDLRATPDDGNAAMELLDRGEATLALVIPPGLGAAIAGGGAPTVQAIADASNANAAQTALAYVEAFARMYGLTLLERSGAVMEPPVSMLQTVLYNPELKSDRFLVPGLIAFILMVSCAVATSLSVVRERETGTMEQVLVSPLTPGQVILGKALPYSVVAIAALVLILLTSVTVFGVEIRGSLVWLAICSLVFIVGAQGFGLLISTATSSQQLAFMLSALLTLLPTFLLSGFAFPIRAMPLAVQLITYAVPGRYFIALLRAIILRGVGPEVFWPNLLALVIFAALMLGISSARLRRVRL